LVATSHNQIIIDAEVAVDQSIAHAGHGAPFELRVLLPEVLWNVLSRFADYLDAANERSLQSFIDKEFVALDASRLRFSLFGFNQHVLKIFNRRR
jgi:hypothetical protein